MQMKEQILPKLISIYSKVENNVLEPSEWWGKYKTVIAVVLWTFKRALISRLSVQVFLSSHFKLIDVNVSNWQDLNII